MCVLVSLHSPLGEWEGVNCEGAEVVGPWLTKGWWWWWYTTAYAAMDSGTHQFNQHDIRWFTDQVQLHSDQPAGAFNICAHEAETNETVEARERERGERERGERERREREREEREREREERERESERERERE